MPAVCQLVDGGAHPRMIERDGGDAVVGGRQGFQGVGEGIRIEDIDMQDVDEGALARQPVGGPPDLLGQVRHELLAPIGRMKAKRKLRLRASLVAAASAR